MGVYPPEGSSSPKDEPSPQDLHFYSQVQKLVRLAENALEEAESYVDGIENPELRKKARNLL